MEVVAAQGTDGGVDAVDDRAEEPGDDQGQGDEEGQAVDNDQQPAPVELSPALPAAVAPPLPVGQVDQQDEADDPEGD